MGYRHQPMDHLYGHRVGDPHAYFEVSAYKPPYYVSRNDWEYTTNCHWWLLRLVIILTLRQLGAIMLSLSNE